MGEAIAGSVPLAVGVALSPVPMIAAIVMLLARRSTETGVGFLVGWMAGIAAATILFVVLEARFGGGGGSDSSMVGSWMLVCLGALLFLLGAGQWLRRSRTVGGATLPRWLTAVDALSWGKAAGLGVALPAVNPKILLVCAAAGSAIGGASVNTADRMVAVGLFTVVGACTVAVPVASYLLAGDRVRAPLGSLRAWLEVKGAPVVAVLLLGIGVLLFAQGFARLEA